MKEAVSYADYFLCRRFCVPSQDLTPPLIAHGNVCPSANLLILPMGQAQNDAYNCYVHKACQMSEQPPHCLKICPLFCA